MGGFFGMLKENKYIQKGWAFNPREVLKKSQTNSCADSMSPWSGRFSTVCSVTLRAITRLFGLFPGLFCGAARAEPDWAESQNTLIQALLPRRRGKAKPVTSYTYASSSHKALLLLLLALREAFPAFQSSAPEHFSSLDSPKHPQPPQGILASEQPARAPCQANPLASSGTLTRCYLHLPAHNDKYFSICFLSFLKV